MASIIVAEAAVDEISKLQGTITPFPGGVVASGSKVGSKYKFLKASTNQAFCPTYMRSVPPSWGSGGWASHGLERQPRA